MLYSISISLYKTLVRTVAPFNPKAKLWLEGRKNWQDRMRQAMEGETAPIAWFHCASLGEFEQGRPVIEAFREAFPHFKILLTFFSPSGYEVRKNYEGADYIFYLPEDSEKNAKQFIEIAKPQIAFFVKYEFWHYYFKALKEQKTPILSISAIFRDKQIYFKPYGSFYRNILKQVDHFFVQGKHSKTLLKEHDITNATIAGDTRFDRVKQICDQAKDIPLAEQFTQGKPTLVIGSAWKQDMDVLMPFLNDFEHPLKVILAPHEIHDSEIEGYRKTFHKKSIRFSQATLETVQEADLLIIDNVGMLSSLYRYGTFAYIGGSFGKGLHNTLEAGTYGMPIFFGNKNYQKFKEAVELSELGGAFPIGSTEEFTNTFRSLYENEGKRTKASNICRQYIADNVGATAKIIDFCKELLTPKA